MMSNIQGIVIAASPFDWLFAKGCIASCAYFAPDTPVQVIIDGEIDTTTAELTFGVHVTRASKVPNPSLREKSRGWGKTKMIAFWESKFDSFLYLDSDTILWGNVLERLHLNGHDFLSSKDPVPQRSQTEVENWFFETAFVQKHFPEWDWRAAAKHLFCTGTFVSRRHVFPLETYLSLLRLDERSPGRFKFGEMGILNFMVFHGAALGDLRVASQDFQVIFPEYTRDELQQRFSFDSNGTPIVAAGDERVLHMPDQKPLVDNPNCYSHPMTFFRLKYLEQTEGITGELAMMRLRQEDENYHRLRADFLGRQKRQKFIKLLQGHPGYWGQLCKRLLRFK